ncbi:MAG: hypothetical protein ABIO70_23395 [Pseudomonadota bacterium]
MGCSASALWLILALGVAPVQAADPPAFPPAHLRAVELPPARWGAIFAPRRAVRLFWNGGAAYTVQVSKGEYWETLEREATSGWVSPVMARGTRLRLVAADDRASPPLAARTMVSPLQLAVLAGPRGAGPGGSLVDLAIDGDGAVWAASLGGGVTRYLPEDLSALGVGRAEGLPSERVLAVAPTEHGAWVGTAGGLVHVQIEGGGTGAQRIVVSDVLGRAEGLPDDYVQALATDVAGVWIGTFRGLSHLTAAGLAKVLGPWSVFSLVRGADERTWVGYEGLLGLPEGEPIEGVGSDLDVYDVEPLPRTGTLLATLQRGVVLLEEGELRPVWAGRGDDGAYAIARVAGTWLAAGAEAGLVSLSPGHGVLQAWGEGDGLPSSVVNEVIPDLPWEPSGAARPALNARGAWLGTREGLAWLDPEASTVRVAPLAGLPAGLAWRAFAEAGRGERVLGETGSAALGRTSGRVRRESERLGPDLVALLRVAGTRWLVRAEGVLQQPQVGRPRLHAVPGPILAAAVVEGRPWVGGEPGLFRYDPIDGVFLHLGGVGPVKRLAVGADGQLWAIASNTLAAIGRDGSLRPYLGSHTPLDIAPDGAVVWVGTDNGIDVISVADGTVVDLLRTADRRVAVTAIAADGEGGCWAGTEAGQVIHLDTSLLGGATVMDLAPEEPPRVLAIHALDAQRAWVLTDLGAYALWRPRTPAP